MPGGDRAEALAIAIVAAATLLAGGFALIPPHGVFREPHSLTKNLAIVAIALTAIAAPFAFGEAVADRRFEKERRRLEAERAWTRVAGYEGPEGAGVLFEAPDARILLARPTGGLGAPRAVALAPPVAADADARAPDGVEAPAA